MRFCLPIILLLFLACQSEKANSDDWCCAELRVVHLAPTTPSVRVDLDYFNSSVRLSDTLAYAKALPLFEYLRIDASVPSNERGWPQYRLIASPLGSHSDQALSIRTLQLERSQSYSFVLSDTGLSPSWVTLTDRAPPVGQADTNSIYIRLVNLSNVKGATLALQNRNSEPALPYAASPWLRLPAGTHRLQVRDASQNILWMETMPRNLLPKRVYQAYFNRDTLLIISDRFR